MLKNINSDNKDVYSDDLYKRIEVIEMQDSHVNDCIDTSNYLEKSKIIRSHMIERKAHRKRSMSNSSMVIADTESTVSATTRNTYMMAT